MRVPASDYSKRRKSGFPGGLRSYARAHLLAELDAADWLGPAAPDAMARVTVRCHEALHAEELDVNTKTSTYNAVNMCLP